MHDQVMPAWRDVGDAGFERFPTRGFDDANLADLVESIGEGLGEARRHVLRDDDRRRLGRHAGQHRFDRLRTAGRCADRDDAVAAARLSRIGQWTLAPVGRGVAATARARLDWRHAANRAHAIA